MLRQLLRIVHKVFEDISKFWPLFGVVGVMGLVSAINDGDIGMVLVSILVLATAVLAFIVRRQLKSSSRST